MARSHCTGPGQGQGLVTVGYYIICRTVHTTPEQGQGQGPENLSMGFQSIFQDLEYFPVYFVMDFSYINNISRSHFQSQSLCNVNITPRSLSCAGSVQCERAISSGFSSGFKSKNLNYSSCLIGHVFEINKIRIVVILQLIISTNFCLCFNWTKGIYS